MLEQVIHHQAHHHAAGVPAAGDDALEDGFFCGRMVDVKRLRVEIRGEGDDFRLRHVALAQVDFQSLRKIFEIPVLGFDSGQCGHAVSVGKKPGWAIKRSI